MREKLEEAASRIRAHASDLMTQGRDFAEDNAPGEFDTSQREIARMLRIVANNLNLRIRCEMEPMLVK